MTLFACMKRHTTVPALFACPPVALRVPDLRSHITLDSQWRSLKRGEKPRWARGKSRLRIDMEQNASTVPLSKFGSHPLALGLPDLPSKESKVASGDYFSEAVRLRAHK